MEQKVTTIIDTFRSVSVQRKLGVVGIVLAVLALPVFLIGARLQHNTRQHAGGFEESAVLSLIPNTQSVKQGQTITEDVYLDPGKDKASFINLHIQYDPARLTLLSFVPSAPFSILSKGQPSATPPTVSPSPPPGCMYVARPCSYNRENPWGNNCGYDLQCPPTPTIVQSCTDNTQCPSGYACLNEPGRENPTLPSGGGGSICVPVSDGTGGVSGGNGTIYPARDECASDNQCPQGYSCRRIGISCTQDSPPDCSGIHSFCEPKNPTTCIPRPSCLDSTPRCLIAERSDWCPTPTPSVSCTPLPWCIDHAPYCEAMPQEPPGGWCPPSSTPGYPSDNPCYPRFNHERPNPGCPATTDIIYGLGVGASRTNAITKKTKVGRITFTALSATDSNGTKVTFANDNVVLALNTESAGSNILQSTQDATILINPTNATPTPTPNPNATLLNFTLTLNAFDTSVIPQHPDKKLLVEVFDKNNKKIGDARGTVSYILADSTFQGAIDIGSIPYQQKTSYVIKVTSPGYLRRQIPGIYQLHTGSTDMQTATLIAGDVNGDNVINILDYNIISDCFEAKATSATCLTHAEHANADIDDNGKIDGVDYNIFLRSLKTQHGD